MPKSKYGEMGPDFYCPPDDTCRMIFEAKMVLVKRGCQLFLKRGLLSLPTQDNTRVAFYSPQMPYAVSTVDPFKPGAAGLMKQVSGPY